MLRQSKNCMQFSNIKLKFWQYIAVLWPFSRNEPLHNKNRIFGMSSSPQNEKNKSQNKAQNLFPLSKYKCFIGLAFFFWKKKKEKSLRYSSSDKVLVFIINKAFCVLDFSELSWKLWKISQLQFSMICWLDFWFFWWQVAIQRIVSQTFYTLYICWYIVCSDYQWQIERRDETP